MAFSLSYTSQKTMAIYIIGFCSFLALSTGATFSTTRKKTTTYTSPGIFRTKLQQTTPMYTPSGPRDYCYELHGVESKCFKCPVGYYGPYCNTICGSCKSTYYSFGNSSSSLLIGKFCDSESGKCIAGCSWSWSGDTCDVQGHCGPSGRDDRGKCQECSQGYYGYQCASRCSYRCKDLVCEEERGACYECQPGYYGTTCNLQCKNCLEGLCDRFDGICLQCEPGFHGHYCNETCGQCRSHDAQVSDIGQCDRVTSKCDYGCKTGFQDEDCYRSHTGKYCYTSRNGPLHCSDCPVGTYGEHCEKECSSQCAMTEYTGRFCEKVSGKCFGCEDYWFGDRCGCKGFCDDKGCDDDGFCYNCAIGYYGSYCSQQCRTNCDNNSCDRNGDCDKCLPGYYGSNCYDSCKANCKDGRCNKNNGFCSACPTGQYGVYCNETCGQCARVPEPLDIQSCNRFTGTCISGCMEGYDGETCHQSHDGRFCYNLTSGSHMNCFNCRVGWYGSNCDQMCNENCVVTQYLGKVCGQDSGECTECENGWYGITCECRGHCNSEGCGKNGICYGCQSGYWGPYCALACNNGCDNDVCNEVNGLCYACGSKLYGNHCNLTCSNCHQNCNRITGACLDGCAVGFYGHACEINCSKCKLSDDVDEGAIPCDVTSGHCKDGCVLGSYGLQCDKVCDCGAKGCDKYAGACHDSCVSGFTGSTCRTSPEGNGRGDTSIGIIAGAGLVTGFTILVLVITIVVIIRRRSAATMGETAVEVTNKRPTQHIYTDLQKVQTPGYDNTMYHSGSL